MWLVKRLQRISDELESMTERHRKTAVIIAYLYPPSCYFEIAGQRPAKWLKFLPEFGWNAIVLTRYWDEQSKYDTMAVPTDMPPPQAWLSDCAAQQAWDSVETQRRACIRVPFKPRCASLLYQRISLSSGRNRLFVPLRKTLSLLQPWFLPYSSDTVWLPHAKAAYNSLQRLGKIDAIVATAAPLESHILAAQLARKFSVPWVADFRDKWDGQFRSRWVGRMLLPVFRKMYGAAASLVTVTPEIAAEQERLLGRSIEVIPNGFDVSDFPKSTDRVPDTFRIVYTGKLYTVTREPDVFFKGLKLFLDAVAPPDVSFEYYGRSSSMVAAQARAAGVQAAVTIHGHATREIALQAQVDADVLLLVSDTSGQKGIATGKIYEYFAAQRPILVVPGDGSTVDRLVQSTGTGLIARTPSQVQQCLDAWYRCWKSGKCIPMSPNSDEILKYSRRDQTAKLARLLDAAILSR